MTILTQSFLQDFNVLKTNKNISKDFVNDLGLLLFEIESRVTLYSSVCDCFLLNPLIFKVAWPWIKDRISLVHSLARQQARRI